MSYIDYASKGLGKPLYTASPTHLRLICGSGLVTNDTASHISVKPPRSVSGSNQQAAIARMGLVSCFVRAILAVSISRGWSATAATT